MQTAMLPLMGALVTALRSHPLSCPVYDEVPPTAHLPYVTVGSIIESEADAHNQTGIDAFVALHVWSDYPGIKEAAEIAAELAAALDRRPLTVAGWKNVSVSMQNVSPVPDPDTKIRHINASFRVWLTKEA